MSERYKIIYRGNMKTNKPSIAHDSVMRPVHKQRTMLA